MRHRPLHAMCLALLVTSCTDLTAVQKFAATSSAISTNEPVLSSWPTAYDRVTSLASTQAVLTVSPDAKQSFIDKETQTTNDAKLGTQAAQMLGLYLQTLSQLAGGSVTDVSKQSSSLQTSIKTLGAASKDITLATDALALLLNAWQNKAVGDVVTAADGPVQTITTYLANTADAVRLSSAEARSSSDQYWTAIGLRSKDIYMQAVLQRLMLEDDIYYQAQIDKASAARLAFAKIGTDHAALAKNANSLSGARATLEADQPLLQNALATLLK